MTGAEIGLPLLQFGLGTLGSSIGSRMNRSATTAFRNQVMGATAPDPQEAALRNALLFQAQSEAGGQVDPRIQLQADRQHALSLADLARQSLVEQAGVKSNLANSGLLGTAAGQAILARQGVEESMRRDRMNVGREGRMLDLSDAARSRGLSMMGGLADAMGRDRQTRLNALMGLGAPNDGAQMAAGGGAMARDAIAQMLAGYQREQADERYWNNMDQWMTRMRLQ